MNIEYYNWKICFKMFYIGTNLTKFNNTRVTIVCVCIVTCFYHISWLIHVSGAEGTLYIGE